MAGEDDEARRRRKLANLDRRAAEDAAREEQRKIHRVDADWPTEYLPFVREHLAHIRELAETDEFRGQRYVDRVVAKYEDEVCDEEEKVAAGNPSPMERRMDYARDATVRDLARANLRCLIRIIAEEEAWEAARLAEEAKESAAPAVKDEHKPL